MIVLIGATGTVGRHVAHELTARGMPFCALVRDARLSRAGLDAILALLAEKESRLQDSPADTPLISLDADPDGHLGNGRPNPPAGALHSAVRRSFSERYHAPSSGRWPLQP